MTYIIYCAKCKKILRNEEVKCPLCGGEVRELGHITASASNGEYKNHI